MKTLSRLLFVLAGLLMAVGATAQPVNEPRVASERVVFRTDIGDIVLALYPDAAPKTVQQVLKLTKLGVFSTVHVARVEPGFVVQLGSAVDREIPMSAEQAAGIAKIPLEISALRHQQGSLSMAHGEDPNDAESSFSILLGPAPHLDGKYTVFGRVESGFDVVQELARVPVDAASHRPLKPLLIGQGIVAEVADLGKFQLRSGVVRPVSAQPSQATSPGPDIGSATGTGKSPLVTVCFLAILAGLGLCTFLFAGKLSPRAVGSIGLLVVMVSFFFAFTVLSPLAPTTSWLSIAMFLGTIGFIRLMNRFESPR